VSSDKRIGIYHEGVLNKVAGCCEHGNEHSAFIEDGEYVDHVSDCHFLVIGWEKFVCAMPAFGIDTDPHN
jgi:hypothetical protein